MPPTTVPTSQPPPSTQQPASTTRRTPTPRTTTATSTSTQAPVARRFDPSAYFRIANHVNSLLLDSGGHVRPGTPMKLWEPTSPSPNLQFRLVETGDGHYRLVNRTNGLTVDGRGATTAGAHVGQRHWDSNPAMQWLPTEVGDGLFTLKNRATGMLLDGGGWRTHYGDLAKQWPAVRSPNLLWRIVPV